LFFNSIQKKIKRITEKSLIKIILKNIKFNKNFIIDRDNQKLKKLKHKLNKKSNFAVIVAAGPSLRKNDFRNLLKKNRKKILIICADSSLYYLLEKKIIPDLIVTLDPHKDRIIRWFGDENLKISKLRKDNYFRKQDLDVSYKNEIKNNRDVLKLTKKYGSQLNIAACTSSSKKVVERLIKIKAKIFWWHPFLDDVKKKNSITKKVYKIKNLPIINSLGNVGSACWIFAESIFECKKIALLGMDFGYYIDTPLESTQYYNLLKKNFGKKNIKYFYKKIFNKFTKKFYYTDHVYYWYQKIFYEALQNSKAKTFNCTNGGILFKKPIINCSFRHFLRDNHLDYS
tara:strand:+ start:5651 stop:6676 length:1026 start_codon:yes stop_codon:yes gene_type:complete